jgi:hypothetical protein
VGWDRDKDKAKDKVRDRAALKALVRVKDLKVVKMDSKGLWVNKMVLRAVKIRETKPKEDPKVRLYKIKLSALKLPDSTPPKMALRESSRVVP